MARQKVKLASGLTVRDGDTVIVSVTGVYSAATDTVKVYTATGHHVGTFRDLSRANRQGEATVAKIKRAQDD